MRDRWLAAPEGRPLVTVLERLDDALEAAVLGAPRLFELPALDPGVRAIVMRVAARLARRDGWVPVSLDVLIGLLDHGCPDWLKERSLVIFLDARDRTCARVAALGRLGDLSTRPHLVIHTPPRRRTNRVRLMRRCLLVPRTRQHLSRFAPMNVDASIAAEVRARWRLIALELACRGAVDIAAARIELARVLAVRGKRFESRALLMSARGEPRVRAETKAAESFVARLARHEAAARLARLIGRPLEEGGETMVDDFVGVLQLCQDIEDEQVTLVRVGAFLRERLQAAAIVFVARDDGGLRVLARAGADGSAMGAARQSIDAGCPVPASGERGPAEAAQPVRQGAEVIGAVWCRWSTGTPIARREAGTLLGVAAAGIAPSVRALVERYRPRAVGSTEVPELVGESGAIRTVRAAILRAATSPFPVLVEGESGSGKELVARAIHTCGTRRDRRFCAINCAALVDELVEAELFGHTRSAFTGAGTDRAGLFEEASGGTLFLDEVAELGAKVQAKLLRTLQEGEVRRIGESSVRRVDVRIVAATNRPLAGEVAGGRFRRDLWYRLDVVRMTIPPLRERLEDLPLLVRHLWMRLAERTGSRATLSPGAMAALAAYDWPGNVRELQNVLASALVAAPKRGVIGPSAWPAHIARVAALAPAPTLDSARRQFEERFVRAALARAGGRTSVAARELGLSRQGLRKMLARLGIPRVDARHAAPRVLERG